MKERAETAIEGDDATGKGDDEIEEGRKVSIGAVEVKVKKGDTNGDDDDESEKRFNETIEGASKVVDDASLSASIEEKETKRPPRELTAESKRDIYASQRG